MRIWCSGFNRRLGFLVYLHLYFKFVVSFVKQQCVLDRDERKCLRVFALINADVCRHKNTLLL